MFSMLAAPSGAERGLEFKCRGGAGWLPVGREQDGQVVLVGHLIGVRCGVEIKG